MSARNSDQIDYVYIVFASLRWTQFSRNLSFRMLTLFFCNLGFRQVWVIFWRCHLVKAHIWSHLEDAQFLGCQSWQSRVADFFLLCWAVFSKRTLLTRSVVWNKAQIKHIKNFSIKNFGPPKTPQILYVWVFSCILKGKEPPNIKNLRGQGSLLGGGSRRGISGKILYVSALLWVLMEGCAATLVPSISSS